MSFYDGTITSYSRATFSLSVNIKNNVVYADDDTGFVTYYTAETGWVSSGIGSTALCASYFGNITYVCQLNTLQRYSIPTYTSFLTPNIDNDVSLGTPSLRYTNGYFANAVYANGIQLTSDERFKTNIEPIVSTKLRDLRPVSYMIGGKKKYGLLAQEVQKVYPELVEGDEKLSLDMESLIALLVKELFP
jgi:hypothetical protein